VNRNATLEKFLSLLVDRGSTEQRRRRHRAALRLQSGWYCHSSGNDITRVAIRLPSVTVGLGR